MKKIVAPLILIVVIITSCNKKDENTAPVLVGKWRIIEAYVDPGDGSGTFSPVGSTKTLEFFSGGMIKSSNGSLCAISLTATDNSSIGTYDLEQSIINPSDCNSIHFEIQDSYLFIYYLCDEGCGEKYIKVD